MTVDASSPDPADAAPLIDAGPIIVDFTPSNIPTAQLTAATNRLTLQASDGVVEINTDTGAITRLSDFADLHPLGVGFTTINQSGAPNIGVFSMTALIVESGVILRVRGSAALAFAVKTDVHLAGTIDASAGRSDSSDAGPGGYRGGLPGGCGGAGAGGGTAGGGSDVGGGGGGHLAGGGAGGGRAAAVGGRGGPSNGGSSVPLVGGAGGGCGGGSAPVAHGGGGGGAVQISARGEIYVAPDGVINVAAAGGAGGLADNGGAGGGAGGAVLLEAGRIVIDGAVAANGGGGGAGANLSQSGQAGTSGRTNTNRASGGTAAGDGQEGGAGGAGGSPAGMTGGHAAGTTGSDNGGGGGGSAGRIRLRSSDIRRPGILSPISGLTESSL